MKKRKVTKKGKISNKDLIEAYKIWLFDCVKRIEFHMMMMELETTMIRFLETAMKGYKLFSKNKILKERRIKNG